MTPLGRRPGKAVVSIASEPEDLSSPRRLAPGHRTSRPRDRTAGTKRSRSRWHAPPSSGSPESGPDRELKFALESHWAGRTGAEELRETAAALRAAAWSRARDAGIDVIPAATRASTTTCSTPRGASTRSPSASAGRAPRGWTAYFAMARGSRRRPPARDDQVVRHELPLPRAGAGADGQRFRARPDHWVEQLEQARRARDRDAAGGARPVQLPAPVEGPRPRPLDALGVARAGVRRAARAPWPRAGATEVQIDEPCLALDPTAAELDAAVAALGTLAAVRARHLPGDLLRAPRRRGRSSALAALPPRRAAPRPRARRPASSSPALARPARRGDAAVARASWTAATSGRADLDRGPRAARRGDRRRSAAIASRSPRRARCCTSRTTRRARRASREEVRGLAGVRGASGSTSWRRWPARPAPPASATILLADSRERAASRRDSSRTNDPTVRARAGSARATRTTTAPRPFERRRAAQRERLGLPELPTTTIGSFPQTDGDPGRPPRPARGRARRRPTTRASSRSGSAEVVAGPGGARPGRARARRARAQRHGRVLRRAAARLRVLRARLGAVVRQPLRQAADPLRRRVAARRR